MTAYELSWEEYLDICRHSSGTPESSISALTIWAGIMCATFGIILSEQGHSESSLGPWFMVLALVLFFAAWWDHKVRRPRRKRQSEAAYRSSYESYFSGPRTFSFDGSHWTLQTETGNQRTNWNGLLAATEGQHTFALWATNQIVMVPKRALSLEELDSLRDLALGTGTIRASFHVSWIDYLVTEVPLLWRRGYPALSSYIVVAIFIFGIAVNFLRAPVVIWDAVAALVLGAMALLFVQVFSVTQRYIQARDSVAVSWEGVFSTRGGRAKTKKSDGFIAWPWFKGFRETKRCFLLYSKEDSYFILVKKCLTNDQQNTLRELFKSKLPKR